MVQIMRNPHAPFGLPAGIGLQFVRPKPFKTGPFTIMGLSEDGQARKSGLLKVGDVIHEVNGVNVYGSSEGQVVNMVCGPGGTFVSLTVSGPEILNGAVVGTPRTAPSHSALQATQPEYKTIQIIRNPQVRGGAAGVSKIDRVHARDV